MGIGQLSETVHGWDSTLSSSMKNYIHYYSIRNFILHYDEIKSSRAQEDIRSLLTE